MATNLEFINRFEASGVSFLQIDNIFSDKYDVYCIQTDELTRTTSGSNYFAIRLVDSTDTVITGAEYDYAYLNTKSYGAFVESRSTSATTIEGFGYSQTNALNTTTNNIWYIYNPYDSSSYTFTLGQSSIMVDGYGVTGFKQIGVHKVAEQINGIYIYSASVPFNIKLSVYGVK